MRGKNGVFGGVGRYGDDEDVKYLYVNIVI